ncbi:MFS transporter [Nocardia jiangxiensis]|uniref:MFS transporter n=1 Tax=Nocardia jiangxiensis TaxID=282685 RepID=A0ABW6SFS8_9NOCA|nr:MFS transporter [Nocardia jiangxiensis]
MAKRIYNKISWRLFPLVIACYFISFLDRTNIGIAQLQMNKQLGLGDAAFGLGAGVFFIAYLIFEVPSNLYMHKVGAKKTIMRIMILWGLVSICFMFVQNPTEFLILRFLLGATEAGFFPGMILYLTYWYPSEWRARAVAIFIVAQPASGLVGAPLGGWILKAFDHVGGLSGWRWLFFVEGVPAVILGIAVLWLLADGPRQVKWLTEDEKNFVIGNLAREHEQKKTLVPHSLRELVRNGRVVLLVVLVFAESMGLYGLTFYLPTLVKGAGIHSSVTIGFITAIPFLCGMIAMVLVSRSSDRRRERRWHLSIPFVVSAVGLSASAVLGGNHTVPAIIALCVAAAGVYTVSALCWNLPPAFFAGTAAAAGIAAINSLGNLGGFVSPYLIGMSQSMGGGTSVGLYILSAVLVIGAILTHRIPAHMVNR